MVQYSDELKEEIRSANDIVDVISQYVTLKRSGRNFFGLCPFHKEKSPSFSVSPDRQYYHCFGCHKGGDVFNFVSEVERISFKEALEFLAERGRITLPTVNNEEFNKTQYIKDRMYKINSETTMFYHERLYKPLAKIAQNYVKQRKLDNATLKAFKIGYSGEFNELYKFLKSKGFKDEEILSTGLVNRNDRGEFIDRFRKRLMFPIMDVNGRVVAFGGRKLEENEKLAKYINSNENLIYSKKKHLFALNLAKQTGEKKIILVEGYMDAISLHQRGIKNVVASLGTALTEEQGRLLRKYSEQVLFSYDSDGAGQEAIKRGLEVLEAQGCDARVIQMEGAKDPDEFIIKYGTGRFNMLVQNAISLTEFKIKVLKQNYNLDNPSDKVKFLRAVTKLLSEIDDKIEREIFIEKVSNQYEISREAIYAEVNKLLYKNDTSINSLTKNVVKKEEAPVTPADEAAVKRENLIIYLLINNPKEAFVKLISNIGLEDFKNEYNRIIFEKIKDLENVSESTIMKTISNIEDEELQRHVSELMVSDYEITSPQKCIDELLLTYNKDRLNNRKLEIIKALENKELSKEEIASLEQELSVIIVELARRK